MADRSSMGLTWADDLLLCLWFCIVLCFSTNCRNNVKCLQKNKKIIRLPVKSPSSQCLHQQQKAQVRNVENTFAWDVSCMMWLKLFNVPYHSLKGSYLYLGSKQSRRGSRICRRCWVPGASKHVGSHWFSQWSWSSAWSYTVHEEAGSRPYWSGK